MSRSVKVRPTKVGDKYTRVIDPATNEPLPQAGSTVPLTPYWRRRLKDESVEVVEEKKARRASKD